MKMTESESPGAEPAFRHTGYSGRCRKNKMLAANPRPFTATPAMIAGYPASGGKPDPVKTESSSSIHSADGTGETRQEDPDALYAAGARYVN